jgi:hypothetical protein
LPIKEDFPELVEGEVAFQVFGLDLVLDSLAQSELGEGFQESNGLLSVFLERDLYDASVESVEHVVVWGGGENHDEVPMKGQSCLNNSKSAI